MNRTRTQMSSKHTMTNLTSTKMSNQHCKNAEIIMPKKIKEIVISKIIKMTTITTMKRRVSRIDVEQSYCPGLYRR